MKKLLSICAAAAIVAACTGVTPTKVESKKCNCLLCEASDSLDYYAKLDSAAWDSTWVYPHSDNFDEWYDSLTVIVCHELSTSENLDSTIKDILASESFMRCIYSGFDGLYGDCYDTLSCEIDKFYTILENK